MKLAVVELEVGEKACFLVGAIGTNEGALVVGSVDKAALRFGISCLQDLELQAGRVNITA